MYSIPIREHSRGVMGRVVTTIVARDGFGTEGKGTTVVSIPIDGGSTKGGDLGTDVVYW